MPKTPPISASDKKLFRESVGECTPTPGNKSYTKKPRNTRTNHPPLDEPLPPLISYAVGEITPITPEQVITYRKSGVPAKTEKALRQGTHPIDAKLDLHGMSVDQAEDACQRFLSDAMGSGYHTVQIIHGKGASPTQALLKSHLNAWLRADPHVNAFSSCPPKSGGTGAVFVAIRQKKGQDWY